MVKSNVSGVRMNISPKGKEGENECKLPCYFILYVNIVYLPSSRSLHSSAVSSEQASFVLLTTLGNNRNGKSN